MDYKEFDPRTWLVLNVISTCTIMFVKTEVASLSLFAGCILIHLIARKTKYIMSYISSYIILTGLVWIGTQLTMLDLPQTGIVFSVPGQMGRRMLIPLSFAIILASTPTGAFLEAIAKMKLPKAFGIGIAVILRFFPTILQEYRMIRNSQKFRGIGINLWDKITQLPQIIENTLIPLIMRTSKIAEELSASVTVRGIRFTGEVISFTPMHLKAKDKALMITTVLYCIGIYIIDMFAVGGFI